MNKSRLLFKIYFQSTIYFGISELLGQTLSQKIELCRLFTGLNTQYVVMLIVA